MVTLLVCFLHLHTRLRVPALHLPSLRPLLPEVGSLNNSDAIAPRECELLRKSFVLPSFRDGPQDRTRNLEIPGSLVSLAPRNDDPKISPV